MNRSGCLSASAAVHTSLIGRWLAAVLTLVGCAAALMSGVVVLAGVSVVALVVGARLRWLDGGGPASHPQVAPSACRSLSTRWSLAVPTIPDSQRREAYGLQIALSRPGALLAALASGPVMADGAATATPQATIQKVTVDGLAALRANQDRLRKDPVGVTALIARIVDPYLDFTVMSEEVLGVSWRRADDQQRARFTQAFQQLLADDYVAVVKQYSGQTVKVTGVRWEDAAHDRATVSSQVESPGTQALQVDYRMYHTGAKWKVYDVVVDGVSLLINYREAFASELRHEGLDALISRLEDKVAGDRAAASQ
jgi:phospholipid transport system substrate-binding protein